MKRFACGCSFETDAAGNVIYSPDIPKLPLTCDATWNMICEGNTKGVFQLESQLGRSMASQVQPRDIEELSDLVAIIRPGCMEAMVNGKSLTNHYIDRKHKRDAVDYLHPSLEPILSNTYGILVYQEQALLIARDIAGFNLQEADILRKAIGKKNVGLMSDLKQKFVDGTQKQGLIGKEQALEIFGWIEKSQRYSFNKSHSISYAFNAYLTAYTKAHFPLEFFTSYLKNSIGKPDAYVEIEGLINNAKVMNIEVMPPNIKKMNKSFSLIGKNPTFGITEIKGVGGSVYDKMIDCIKKNRISLERCDWETFLIGFGRCIKVDSFEALILSGALDCFDLPRSKMCHELRMFRELSKREIPWIEKHKNQSPSLSLLNCIRDMVMYNDWSDPKRPIYRKDRVEVVESIADSMQDAGYNLVDSPSWLALQESKYLGTPLTCAKVDEYDTSSSNCTCKEFLNGFNSRNGIIIAAQIEAVREWKIKKGSAKGQQMAFLTISDASCSMDSATMFSEEWDKYRALVKEGEVLLLRGSKDLKRGSFLIKSVSRIKNLL
jgi:DNA polymerase-3 subunit alpha